MNLLVLQSYSHSVSHGCDLLYIFAYNSRIPVLEYSSAHNILLNTAYKINFWNMFYSHNFYFKCRIHIEGLHSFPACPFYWLCICLSGFICFTFSLFSISQFLSLSVLLFPFSQLLRSYGQVVLVLLEFLWKLYTWTFFPAPEQSQHFLYARYCITFLSL